MPSPVRRSWLIEEADESAAADLEDDHPAGNVAQSERVPLKRPGGVEIAEHSFGVDQDHLLFRPPAPMHLLQNRLGRQRRRGQTKHDVALLRAGHVGNSMICSGTVRERAVSPGAIRALGGVNQVSDGVYAKLSSTGL
ncbi:hypothetical protein [Bosea sp. UC22_33]|uniref:hypothetical protein n=1 Tax=Bosea sp. UC22_33 TaxID=3350165 RepID=UPI00366AEDD9